MAVISDLAKFRAVANGTAPPPDPTGCQEVIVNWRGRLLALDQTVSSTGWVLLNTTDGTLIVEETGMVRTLSHLLLKGNADTLARGEEVFAGFCRLMETLQPDRVVHEAPPVGGHIKHPESSLVAATALRCACVAHKVPVTMHHAQAVKNHLTGVPGATKKDMRLAVIRLVPLVVHHKPLNEDVYDAVAVGLLAIERGLG